MKILVTGSTGFVRNALVRKGAIPLNGNFTDSDEVDKLISGICDPKDEFVLIHAAGKTNVEWCEKNAREAIRINSRGTYDLLGVLESYPNSKFMYLSTSHVFSGKKRIYLFSYGERHDPDPVNVYGFSKYGGEAWLGFYPEVPSVAVRVGKAYDQAYIEKTLSLTDDQPTFIHRNFIHVDDLTDILFHLSSLDFFTFPQYKKWSRSSWNVLHVGNPNQNFSYAEFFNLIRNRVGMEPVGKRTHRIESLVARPEWVKFNLNNLLKILPKDFKFRSL